MKKKYYYVMALATLVMGACTDDIDQGGGIPGGGTSTTQDGRTKLKFVLEGLSGGVVPYGAAATVKGENELKTLDIFVFGKDTLPDGTERPGGKMLLEEVFRSDAAGGSADKIDIAADGTSSTAGISLVGINRKRLYFVANGRSQDVFSRFELGKTDTTAFANALTNKLSGHIASPLLMTADHAINIADSIAAKPGAWQTTIDISLKRRMARFDVVNVSVDSRFFIEWIQLINPRAQAYLFDDAAHKTEADADYWTSLGELWATPERIDFKSVDNANNGDALAAFYAYPAPKGTDPIDATKDFSIVLGGRNGPDGMGDPVLYPVLLRKDQKDVATVMTVDANHRYVINVLSVGSNYITATINALDWNVADTLTEHAGYGTFGLSAVATIGMMTGNTLTLASADAAADLAVKVAATTEWTAKVTKGAAWLTLTAPVAGTVAKTLAFATTAANPSSEKVRTGEIVFTNVMRPSITQTLLVSQPLNVTGQHLNVGVPKDIVGLSFDGDTIVLPGYDEIYVAIPVASTDGTVTVTSSVGLFKTAAMNAGGDSVIVTMAENKTGVAKNGTLTLTGATVAQTLSFRQMPMSLGIIRLVCESVAIDEQTITLKNGNALAATEVVVFADSEWTFDGHTDNLGFTQDWVTISAITGPEGKGSFKIAADVNTTFAARSLTIKLVNIFKPEKIYYVLTVKQEANAESITFGTLTGTSVGTTPAALADGVLTISNDEIATFTIATTAALAAGADWELGTITGNDTSWLTVTKETGGLQIVSTANATAGDPQRTATIVVQNAGGTVTKTLTVTQAAAAAIIP